MNCAFGTVKFGWYPVGGTVPRGTGGFEGSGATRKAALRYTPRFPGEYQALAYCIHGPMTSAATNLMGSGGKMTIIAPPGAPGTPTGLTATRGNARVTLDWTPAATTATRGAATGWQYSQRRTQFLEDWGDWTNMTGGASLTRFDVTGLTNGTVYSFRVRATNAAGESQPSAGAIAKPVVPPATPPAPTDLTATASSKTVRLAWKLTGWQYQRRENDGSWGSWTDFPRLRYHIENPVGSTSARHRFTGLTNGTPYCFRVRATDADGPGPPSDVASTIPAAPGTVIVLLTATPSTVTEGSSVTVTVMLSRTLGNSVTIPLTLTRETAEEDDFTAPASIGIRAGVRTNTGTITTHHDPDTLDERFTVSLSESLPSPLVRGAQRSQTVTIDDDDSEPPQPPQPPPSTPNHAPAFVSPARFSAAENQTAAGTVRAIDRDAQDSVTGYAVHGGADRSRFAIAGDGKLTFVSAPDYENPGDADADNRYEVVVRATSGTGPRQQTTDQAVTVTVTDASDRPEGLPVIRGTLRVGETLTADTSGITDQDGLSRVRYDYQWLRVAEGAETPIPGATSISYILAAEDAGKRIRVRVDFTDDDGFAESLTSIPTETVTTDDDDSAPPEPPTTTPNQAPAFTSPARFSAPENQTVAGTVRATDGDAQDGVTAYAVHGGADRSRFSISGDGKLTFVSAPDYENPGDADADNRYEVVVRATSGTGSRRQTVDQAITVTVTDANDRASGLPVIRGTVRVGETLTADTSGITDQDGLSGVRYEYQWLRVEEGAETLIPGATSRTYTLAAEDVGKRIRVKVDFTDDGGFAESLISIPTGTVTASPGEPATGSGGAPPGSPRGAAGFLLVVAVVTAVAATAFAYRRRVRR